MEYFRSYVEDYNTGEPGRKAGRERERERERVCVCAVISVPCALY